MTHASATNYIVCGNDIRDFVIRKSITENAIVTAIGWRTDEKLMSNAQVVLELLKEETSFVPMVMPVQVRKLKSLIFEYPEKTMSSTKSLTEKLSQQQIREEEQESGIRPILPKPDLRSAPEMLVNVNIDINEVMHQVVDKLQMVAKEIFESPESCTSKGDVAGHLNVVAKALRPLSLSELKQVEAKLESQLASQQQERKQLTRNLFYDVVSMIGTNPAVMLSKERVKDTTRVSAFQAVKMVQATINNVRTPTEDLLKELIQLIKNDLRPLAHDRTQVYSVAMVQMSNILYRACIDPAKLNSYPARIYGQFCSQESEPVQQWTEFLKQELTNQHNQQIKLNAISAIGKLGTIRSIQMLAEIVSETQYNEMVRSLAVYSMKRSAKIQPANVKPLLLSIIDNIAEESDVRIAAIAVLPYAQPEAHELQKIAVRTWLEPSKEVASFVYSTFKSLSRTEVPELKLVGQKVVPLMTLVKPFVLGMHYSTNYQSSTLVDYLRMVINQEFSWTKSKVGIVPHRHSWMTMVHGGSYEITGSAFTAYTRGMDKWIDMIMRFSKSISEPSTQVKEQLQKVIRDLKIESRQQAKPELYVQYQFFDSEYSSYLNEDKVVEVLEQLTEQLSRDINALTEEKEIQITRASKLLEAEGLGPCDAGFPVYIERTIPMVLALKATARMEMEEKNSMKIPKMLKAKVIPVANIKLEANMGVISPFNQEFVGTSVEMAIHSASPLEMTLTRRLTALTLDIKIPDEITREIEPLHIFVEPFTVKADLRKVEPLSKAADRKTILSGNPLKEYKASIGQSLDIDAKIEAKSDRTFTDLYSYLEKIREQSVVSLINSFYLPSSLKMSSFRLTIDPRQSRTKEVSITIGALKISKEGSQQQTEIFPAMLPLEPVNDMNHVKQVCMENYPKNPAKYGECVMELSALDYVTESLDSICKVHAFARCKELEQICHKARDMCETKTGFRSETCKKNSQTCLRRIINLQAVHKTLAELDNEGTVVAIRIDADLRGSNKVLSTGLAFGMKKEEQSSTPSKKSIRMVSNIDVKTTDSQVFEIKFVSNAQVPRVQTRWNMEQLLEESLEMLLNGRVQYGYKNRVQKETIKMKSHMKKSQEQRTSVKESPEFKRCSSEEQLGKKLANVCEFSRHQAASIDEISTEIELPESLKKYPNMMRLGEFLRAYFLGQVEEKETSSPVSEKVIRLVAKVNRVGDEAQIAAEIMNKKYEIINLRIPRIFKGILPVSMRNPMIYNFMQKLTKRQIPASCRVEPKYVATFDNKTYSYEMNNCYHLLFKDCSQQIPVAVLARNINSELKEVKVLSGPVETLLTPQSKTDMKLRLNIEGRVEELSIQPGHMREIRTQDMTKVMEIKRFQDNVYLVNAIREKLWVLTDGERIEVSASYMLRSKACGLCGDLNGENTADLKTPERCIMSRPRFAAYSYMMQEPTSCQGIPSQDKAKYEQEKSECVREEIIPTPLMRLSKVVAKSAEQVTKPIISQHLVQRQGTSGKICISVQKVKVCSKINKAETEEPKPVQVERKRVQYVCLDESDRSAVQLEQRARAGETLELTSAGQAISFSKLELEPVLCQRQSNQI